MPKAVVEASRCDPEACESGVCVAKKACPVRAIQQFEPYDLPLSDWSRCRTCSRCLAACPLKAIVLR